MPILRRLSQNEIVRTGRCFGICLFFGDWHILLPGDIGCPQGWMLC